ncbi:MULTISPECIES: hypothetical protein [unclassified Sphingobium]|uniref:hypothetical protein n=1 Tax=unclassified Sphingobium TaxID=2611147 RepID=UPI0035A606D8
MRTETGRERTGALPLNQQELAKRAWAWRHPDRAIEERRLRKARAELIDRWRHKNAGTPETHEANRQRRPGAIARLHASGHLTDDEMAWAEHIAVAAEQIMAGVATRTCSLETRVDMSRHGDAFFEALGAVWREMAYSRWRSAMGPSAALVLDIVVHDVGLARAAAAHHIHVRRARRLLTDALHLWARVHGAVRKDVTAADLVAAHAGLT